MVSPNKSSKVERLDTVKPTDTADEGYMSTIREQKYLQTFSFSLSVFVLVCVRACVLACVRARMCVCVCVFKLELISLSNKN